MKFELIYGRSGTGKSTYIYEKIRKNMHIHNSFLIVPEQSNLMTEKNLMDYTQSNTLLNTEVLTLSRMAKRVKNEIGGSNDNISTAGKAMVIYNILRANKSKLNFLGKNNKNVNIVSQLITEFKKHNIGIDSIQNLEYENKYQELKFKDILLIMEEYNNRISNKFLDENDNLTLLATQIKESHLFDGAHIYIDDFNGFTPQELEIIKGLMDKCDELSIGICLDDLNILTNPANDLFYFNRLFALKMMDLAQGKNCEIKITKLEQVHRFENDEMRYLESNFNNISTNKYPDVPQDIFITIENDKYAEMEDIAKKVFLLVERKGFKYSDIAIVTDNSDQYAEIARAVFAQYNIPIFIDEKKDLNQNILIQYILFMLDIFQKNWTYESVFAYLKTSIFDIEAEQLYDLENYCRKWGIKGNKWKEPFIYEELNEKQEELESLRQKIIIPLIRLYDEIQINRTTKQLCTSLYNYLVSNEIDLKLNKKLENFENIEIIEEYQTTYNALVSILEEMVRIFGDEPTSFEKFKDLLQIGLENTKVGAIPTFQDQLILGDVSRSKNHNIKVLFIVGINDGTFPKASREEGFLNDNDRQYMKSNNLPIAKDSLELLYDQQFSIYSTFTIPSQRLYLSYCSSDSSGSALRPSITIKKIKMLFLKITEKSYLVKEYELIKNSNIMLEQALNKYYEFLTGEEIEDRWIDLISYYFKTNPHLFQKLAAGYNYTNQPETLKKELLDKLYGKNLKTSVSRLEAYRQCPFSYHLTYGLKLKERENLNIQPIDTGSFMHEVIDEFFEHINTNNLSPKTIDDSVEKNIVNQIIDNKLLTNRYKLLTFTPKYIALSQKLKKTVMEVIDYIIYTLKNSNFEIMGNELEFSDNSELKPIRVKLDNGNEVEIVGKIDRVDIGKIDNSTYVRIIDYKSSIKKIDMNKVEAGLQIQLITYLDAIIEQKDFLPGGALYLGMIDKLIESGSNASDEEIEELIRKSYQMKGFVVSDINVIHAMDTSLVDGTSDIIPVTINKSGEINNKKSSIIPMEDFYLLQKKIKTIIKQISKEILSGRIEIMPYKYSSQSGCDYCKYHTICMFDPTRKDNNYFIV